MNQRDLELLSSYLDGQLSPSDSTRLEARLQSDLQLAAVLTDLRATRNLLRKLPQRRAPRNFTLTRKMVGQNPPLPRAYPWFRFTTALATLLFIFSFGLNTVGRQMAAQAPLGVGGGAGGGCEGAGCSEIQSFAAEAAPAATEAPVEAPSVAMAPAPTQMPTEAADAARIVDTPVAAKEAGETENVVSQDQPQVQREAQNPELLVPSAWLIGLISVVAMGLVLMFLMRQMAIRHWRQK